MQRRLPAPRLRSALNAHRYDRRSGCRRCGPELGHLAEKLRPHRVIMLIARDGPGWARRDAAAHAHVDLDAQPVIRFQTAMMPRAAGVASPAAATYQVGRIRLAEQARA